MTGIPVSVGPPTAEGRLFPRYHNRAGLLSLDTSAARPCPIGIRIDGLILDFDEEGILAGAELFAGLRRGKWKADISRPGGGAGDILLRDPRPGSIDYDWPVSLSFDVQSDAGRIGLGSGDYSRSVQLSADCYALLLDDDLIGFWFTLVR
jgi:hypothetical protein